MVIPESEQMPLFFSISDSITGIRRQDIEYNDSIDPLSIPHRVRPRFGLGRRDTEYPLLNHNRGEVLLKHQVQVLEDVIFRLLSSIGHYAFEILTNEILAAELGCHNRQTPRTGDGGIDGIIFSIDSSKPTYLVQCKQYSNPISRSEIEKFSIQAEIWSEENSEDVETIFVAMNGFTSGSKDVADDNEMVLINGKDLAGLAIKNRVGIQLCSFPLLNEKYWKEMYDVR